MHWIGKSHNLYSLFEYFHNLLLYILECRSKLPITQIRHIEAAQQITISPYEQMLMNRKTVAELLALNPMEAEVSIFRIYLNCQFYSLSLIFSTNCYIYY